jgi:hypothetical protein
VGHKLREEVVRACRFDDEDLFRGVLLPPLGRGPGVNPSGCGCSALRGGWLGVARRSSGDAAHWGCQAPRCRGHGCRLGYRNGGRGRCDRLSHYRGTRRGRSGSGIMGVDRGRGVGVVGCTERCPT